MNYSTAVMLINPNIRAISVTYEPDTETTKHQRYTYKTLDHSIAVGDLVVVPTDTRHKMTVVKVEAVDVEVDFEATIQFKWVIDKVSVRENEVVLDEEKKWIEALKASEKRSKREEIKKKMLEMYADSNIDKLPIAGMSDIPAVAAIENKTE